MKRETLSPHCTVLCEYSAEDLSSVLTCIAVKIPRAFSRISDKCSFSVTNKLTPLFCRMNGHSGAAERLLETAGVHMINIRDAKGR